MLGAQSWRREGLVTLSTDCPICLSDFKFQSDLQTLRTGFSNFTSNTTAEVQALNSQGEPGMKGALD